MPLQLNNMAINRHGETPTAQVHMSDEDNCAAIVNIDFGTKPVESYTLQEVTNLAKQAAKHLVSSL